MDVELLTYAYNRMRPEQTAYLDLLSDINFCLLNILCPFLCCLTHQACVWLFGRFSCNLCSTTLTSASIYLRWPHLGLPVLPRSYHIQSLTSWKNDIEKWLILMDVPLATNVPNLTPRVVFGFSNGCEIVLGFSFEQVWEFFWISWLVPFA